MQWLRSLCGRVFLIDGAEAGWQLLYGRGLYGRGLYWVWSFSFVNYQVVEQGPAKLLRITGGSQRK